MARWFNNQLLNRQGSQKHRRPYKLLPTDMPQSTEGGNEETWPENQLLDNEAGRKAKGVLEWQKDRKQELDGCGRRRPGGIRGSGRGGSKLELSILL